MGKRGHSEEEILRVLREAESGDTVVEICRKHGISQQSFYLWKKKYCGPGIAGVARTAAVARREREAEAAGGGSEPGPAHPSGDRRKKTVRPRARRELAEWAQQVHQLSQRRVARLIPIERMTLRYLHHRDPQEALRVRLRELAGSRVRYGYRRLTVLLKREGWQVNAKRIYRLYVEEGLIVRTQKRRERAQRQRVPLGQAVRPNQKWSMDFVAQRLPDGRWIRVLTVVDQFTRECLTLFADNSLSGEKVATALDKVVALRERSRVDHRRQRDGVRKQGDGPLGLQERCASGLHPAGQAGGERLHRKLQRQAARRVPERGGVLQPDRRSPQAASLATGLQPPPTALGLGRSHPGRVRRSMQRWKSRR